jgi:hypothetical protein
VTDQRKTLSESTVLRYELRGVSRATVRRFYLRWRNQQGIPVRCDNEQCRFYHDPLVWNGLPLKLILDHRNGNNSDNRSKNLRFLCPNCDSQLETRGGANRGRIEKAPGGFARVGRDGTKNYILPAESGAMTMSGGVASMKVENE